MARLCGHWNVFVVQRDVIKDVSWIIAVHLCNTMLNYCSHFECERWVIRLACRNCSGEQQTVSVLMLQAFTIERCTTCSRAHEETSGTSICCLPNEVTNTLKAEH